MFYFMRIRSELHYGISGMEQLLEQQDRERMGIIVKNDLSEYGVDKQNPLEAIMLTSLIPAGIIGFIFLLKFLLRSHSDIHVKSSYHSQEDDTALGLTLGDDPQPVNKIGLF